MIIHLHLYANWTELNWTERLHPQPTQSEGHNSNHFPFGPWSVKVLKKIKCKRLPQQKEKKETCPRTYVSVDAWQVSYKHWADGKAIQGQRISFIHRGMSTAAESWEGKCRSGTSSGKEGKKRRLPPRVKAGTSPARVANKGNLKKSICISKKNASK